MRACAAFVLIVTAAAATMAIHVIEEIRKVPVQRLAQNLERQVAEKPDNVEVRLNLARLYAMAYALKVTEFDARAKGADLEPWFGYDPPHVPGPVRPAPSREHEDRAREDLARAIRLYADVIARAPSDPIARLGHAWALEQAGEKVEAIAEYRKAVDLAWPKDRQEQAFWRDPITTEAASRLTALLDRTKDAAEIASLRQKQEVLERKGRMITPIAVPLTAATDRLPVTGDARVLFDADGSGILRRWTWITRDSGWLVYDADGSGRITSALQWFGNVTFWLFWHNGYHALAALDDDHDGRLQRRELAQLAIWNDVNGNGFSEAGEVRPLSAYDIVGLSYHYIEGDGVSVAAFSPAGVTFADGATRPTYDVILHAAGRPVSLTDPVH
jgi:tetratricopeptide (TPR) repeat protein